LGDGDLKSPNWRGFRFLGFARDLKPCPKKSHQTQGKERFQVSFLFLSPKSPLVYLDEEKSKASEQNKLKLTGFMKNCADNQA